MLLEFHLAKDALTLQFLFQGTKRLIDVVVANTDLNVVFTTFLVWSFGIAGSGLLHIAC